MDTAAAILLLSELPGVGEKTLGILLRRCSTQGYELTGVFGMSLDGLSELGLSDASAAAVRAVTPEMTLAAAATARALSAAGIRLVTSGEHLYPRRLIERLPDPPPLLYAYGASEMLTRSTIAVANSNGASEHALALSDAAAESLVQEGWCVVTGHNRPAYQRAALAALRFGAPICYVLDRGLFEAFGDDLRRELFPAAHVWSSAYQPATTLTLTPYPLRAHGIALHNRRRDELIFALADTILVGEVRTGGQMERCVLRALEAGRRVVLLGPPSASDELLNQAGAVRGLSALK
jgi:Predicted Rossmann fold nucleotide-binding protein involved in DNA uptake